MPLQAGLISALGRNLVKGYFVAQATQGSTEGPIAVASSNVASIAYNFDKKSLMVTFIRRPSSDTPDQYVYFDVPSSLWEEFKRAPSKGKFVHTYLKDKYLYDRLQ